MIEEFQNDPTWNLLQTNKMAKRFLDPRIARYTAWKFQDYSITQILCEINFGDCRFTKSAILTLLEALNLDFCEVLNFFVG